MTVSHVNDSYFWVVSKFGEFTKTIDVYKTLTLSTLSPRELRKRKYWQAYAPQLTPLSKKRLSLTI